MLLNRVKYLNAPIMNQASEYYCYNYYSKEELRFSSSKEIIEYLNTRWPVDKKISVSFLASTLSDARKRYKTCLIKGFGIRSDIDSIEYFPYNEEIILSNFKGYKAPVRVYRVIQDSKEDIFYTIQNLCKYFNYVPRRSFNLVTPEEIMQSVNVPNLRIVRLNLPII